MRMMSLRPSEGQYTVFDWRGSYSEGLLLMILSSILLESDMASIILGSGVGVLQGFSFDWRRGGFLCRG